MGRQQQNLIKTGNKKKPSGAQQRKKQAALRATEWDIRFNVSTNSLNDIIHRLKTTLKDQVVYVLVGGEERGTAYQERKMLAVGANTPGLAPYLHHHMCLVVPNTVSRSRIVSMLGLQSPCYCVPRDPKYTYIGWYIHARKPQTKTNPTVLQLYEAGNRPLDSINEHTTKQVAYMVKQYGTPEERQEMRLAKQELRNGINQDVKEEKRKLRIVDKMERLRDQLRSLEETLNHK